MKIGNIPKFFSQTERESFLLHREYSVWLLPVWGGRKREKKLNQSINWLKKRMVHSSIHKRWNESNVSNLANNNSSSGGEGDISSLHAIENATSVHRVKTIFKHSMLSDQHKLWLEPAIILLLSLSYYVNIKIQQSSVTDSISDTLCVRLCSLMRTMLIRFVCRHRELCRSQNLVSLCKLVCMSSEKRLAKTNSSRAELVQSVPSSTD